MVYLAFFIAILVLGMHYGNAEKRSRRNYRKKFVYVASTMLALQSGLRHVAVGADTHAFRVAFERDGGRSWSELLYQATNYYSEGIGKDPGYPLFQKLVYSLIPNYQIYLLLVAFIFFTALGFFVYRNTRTVSDALIAYLIYLTLFYSFFSITGIRQTLVTACVLFSYEFLIKQRKFWLFLLLICVASTIHKSILVFIPFYFIANIKPRKWHAWALAIIFPFLMINSANIFSFLGELSGYENYGIYEGAGTYRFTLIMLFFAAVAFWRIKSVLQTEKEAKSLYNALILAVFLIPLTWINPSAMRLVQYFSLFMLVLAPIVIASIKLNSVKLWRMAYGTCFVVLVAYAVIRGFGHEYAFFWQSMELPENYYR